MSRREALFGAAALSAAVAPREAASAAAGAPEHDDFPFTGTYLNAAYVHPLPREGLEAAQAYARARLADPMAVGPRSNPRDGAVARFARLMGVDPLDVAVVPSTTTGENLLVGALGIGPEAGVVTDSLHYDGSLALYAELARSGVPVGVVAPRSGRIDLADVREAIGPKTRLVAVSLVSSDTGFEYDLAALCEVAHAKGALVYADIIQAAGAVPLDLAASGVDFACSGTYKWLMGEFGAAFLYVRRDRLEQLRRVQVGWRQVKDDVSHVLPFDPPGPAIGDYVLKGGVAGLFENATPAWEALAVSSAGMDLIASRGVETIMAARRPLTERLQEKLAGLGMTPLTPPASRAGVVVFACQGAEARFAARLKAADIRISLYPNRLRISPAIYNTLDDIDALVSVLRA